MGAGGGIRKRGREREREREKLPELGVELMECYVMKREFVIS